MKKIKVNVTKEGLITISTEGFVGQACKDATRELEKALGVVTKESLTDEFYNEGIVEQINTTTNS